VTTIAIVGTGYVGLVTGACLASMGHNVICVDRDRKRVESIQHGIVPFHEPGLEELLSKTLGSNLEVITDLKDAISRSSVTFITVGTPALGDGAIDLRQVLVATHAVGDVLTTIDRPHVVVIKSTVVPGSTERFIAPAIEKAAARSLGEGLSLVVNPEFLTEGTAVEDFLKPDRIVVGSTDKGAANQVAELFRFGPSVPVLVTNPSTAEMIKYASNTLLATLISFSNQIADIGSAIGDIDSAQVMRGVRLSRYLTSAGRTAPIGAFLEAGCGFGGSCLPKDTRALIAEGARSGAAVDFLQSVMEVNNQRTERLLDLVKQIRADLKDVKVSVLGLAFKPDTDDVRESPAFPFISRLLAQGAVVMAHDPVVGNRSIPEDLEIQHSFDLEEAIDFADILVIVTRWDQYSELPELLARRERQPVIVDGRRMLDPGSVDRYLGIGYESQFR
jgi:UDPglucose 6-dehydrogenase